MSCILRNISSHVIHIPSHSYPFTCHVTECVVEGEGSTHVPTRARLFHSLRCTARLFLVDVELGLRCQIHGRLPDVGGGGGLGAVHWLEALGANLCDDLTVVLASVIRNCDGRREDFFPRELRQLVIVVVVLLP